MSKLSTIWIGWEPREAQAYMVARWTARQRMTSPCLIRGLVLDDLIERGMYRRPMRTDKPGYYDLISAAPMATQFAISRFFVPMLTARLRGDGKRGWALFMDCDMLVRGNLSRLFDLADDSKAVMCVKHNHQPANAIKMDGQVQTHYARKNWSSVMLFNCDHPANEDLTPKLLNTAPGRDLHRFCWLTDDLIGELPVEWNWLAGHSDPTIDPKIVHHTDGAPCMEGYEDAPYADEWRKALREAIA